MGNGNLIWFSMCVQGRGHLCVLYLFSFEERVCYAPSMCIVFISDLKLLYFCILLQRPNGERKRKVVVAVCEDLALKLWLPPIHPDLINLSTERQKNYCFEMAHIHLESLDMRP